MAASLAAALVSNGGRSLSLMMRQGAQAGRAEALEMQHWHVNGRNLPRIEVLYPTYR